MCAARVLSIPQMPTNPNVPAIPGLSAVTLLPNAEVPTRHLAINLVRTEPLADSPTHDHGKLDTMLYVLQGTMAFHCGRGMRQDIRVEAGEFAFIEPHAAHAEYDPDPAEYSLGISVRDTPGAFLYPCDPPSETQPERSGIVVVPHTADPINAAPPGEGAEGFAPLSQHHLRARRVALDRLTLAAGERIAPAEAMAGETALLVLEGSARLRDEGASVTLEGASGHWWYIEPGTRWSIENVQADSIAELLLIRSAGGAQK